MKYKYNGQWYDVSIKALDGMPIGAIIAYPSNNIPNGWLECNGSSITSANYPELYDLIGGTLPNLKGRVIVGQDTSQTEFDTLGETGGSKYLQQHNHSIDLYTDGNWTSNSSSGGVANMPIIYSSNIATNNAGTGNSGNLQPYVVCKWIIKAKQTTPLIASVVNTTSASTTDTYSCNYVNNLITSNYDSSSLIGYIKLPGGQAIIHGSYQPIGAITVPAGNGLSVQINFPIQMKANKYTVILTKYAGGNGFAAIMEAAGTFQENSFVLNMWNNASGFDAQVVGYDWLVIGEYK